MTDHFDHLVQEALNHPFSGWDFSWLDGRWYEAEPRWRYRDLVQERAHSAGAVLDMGTGGGEFLASLAELPRATYATEGYPPNLYIAHRRLAPLGIQVVPAGEEDPFPLASETFDLVINRHESFDLSEVRRILKPGGSFLTQQVGPRNCLQLNQYLDGPLEQEALDWSFDQVTGAVETTGFRVVRAEEQLLDSIFFDIGAVVFYLKIIAWQIPDFSLDKYNNRLRALHSTLLRQGAFFTTAHRYLLEAQKV